MLGVLVAPFFIDWSAYRTDFEHEAGRILGRTVTVRGEASARLLPFPSLTFTDVVVAGATPDAAPLLAVDRFRMDAELAPYLSGEIRIFSMELARPHLTLSVDAAGRSATLGAADLPTAATVILEDVAISQGRITIDDRAAGRVEEISALDATLSARSLAGPFSGNGTFQIDGSPYTLQLSSGAAQPGGPLPLRLTVGAPVLDAEIVVDGTLDAAAAAAPRFEGALRLTSPLPPPPNTGPAPAAGASGAERLLPPIAVTSRFVATPADIVLSETRVAAGRRERPYVLTGSGRVDLGTAPRFDLVLTGEQVDVDAVATGTDPALAGSPRQETSLAARLDAARRVIAAVPRPAIPGLVKLTLPVVLAGDTTIRDVAFSATPAPEGWRVEGLTAELPGRTRLEATGLVGLEPLNFAGDLLLASRQPTGFSDWLTGAVDPALRRVSQAGIAARVQLSAEAQRFEDVELDIAGETITGRFETGAGGVTADLAAEGIDLDAAYAVSRLFTAARRPGLTPKDRFALKLSAGPVRFSGAAAERIDADLSFDGHSLAVNRLAVADLAGADLDVSGRLTGLDAEAGGSLTLKLDAPDPARLVAFLAARLPPSPALAVLEARAPALAPLVVGGTVATVTEAAGEKPTLRIALDGKAAETAMTLQVALGNGIYAKGTSGRFGLDVDLSSAAPDGLLRQLGLEAIATPAPAPLGLKLQLSAGATGPVAASAALRAPGTEATAEGTFEVTTAGIASADLGLTATSADLSPWLTMLAIEAGQARTGALPLDLGGDLSWFRGDWTLKGLDAAIAGSTLSGEIQKSADGPVTGRLDMSELSVPWLATLVTGRAPDGAAPGEPWASGGFAAPLLPPVEGMLDINVAALDLGRGAVVRDAAAELDAAADRIAIENLSGAIAGGFLRGGASLRNANGVVGLSVDADFSGLDLGEAILGAEAPAVAPAGQGAAGEDGTGPRAAGEGAAAAGAGDDATEPALAGTLDATVTLEATGQSYPALASALSGAARIEIEDGSIAGLPTGLLAPLLAAADAEGFEPGVATVAPLVAAAAAGGRYPVAKARTELSITGGIARFGPLRIETPGEVLSLSGALDLKRETVAADLRLALEPGEEAVAGTEPAIAYTLSGPIASPDLSTDVQPLATYLGARAVEREEARVQAIQEQLQERLRLRRETRYYKALADERAAAAARAQAEAAEKAEAKAQAEAAERLRLEDERRRSEAAEAARREIDRSRASSPASPAPAAPAAPSSAPSPAAVPAPTPAPETPPARAEPRAPAAPAQRLDLGRTVAPSPAPPPTPAAPFPSLPGVGNPLEF